MSKKKDLDEFGLGGNVRIVDPNESAWLKEIREEAENRRVERTKIGGVEISTVRLAGYGVPQWETMIFGGPLSEYQYEYEKRYSTLADAKAGHREAVKKVVDEMKLTKSRFEIDGEILEPDAHGNVGGHGRLLTAEEIEKLACR